MEIKPSLLVATLSVTAMNFVTNPGTPPPPFAASSPSTTAPSSTAAPSGGPRLPEAEASGIDIDPLVGGVCP